MPLKQTIALTRPSTSIPPSIQFKDIPNYRDTFFKGQEVSGNMLFICPQWNNMDKSILLVEDGHSIGIYKPDDRTWNGVGPYFPAPAGTKATITLTQE